MTDVDLEHVVFDGDHVWLARPGVENCLEECRLACSGLTGDQEGASGVGKEEEQIAYFVTEPSALHDVVQYPGVAAPTPNADQGMLFGGTGGNGNMHTGAVGKGE